MLGASCSLAVEDCTLARGSECRTVPLVCCNNCSGVPLPTASGDRSRLSLLGRAVWLRRLVVQGRKRNNGRWVRAKLLQYVGSVKNRLIFTPLKIISVESQSEIIFSECRGNY